MVQQFGKQKTYNHGTIFDSRFRDVRVVRDPVSGKSKGFGFISFKEEMVSKWVIFLLDGLQAHVHVTWYVGKYACMTITN